MSDASASNMISSKFMRSAGPPKIWTRSRNAKDNFVVMNNDQIAVATVPKSQFAAIRDRLERGSPVEEVVGSRGTAISFLAVRAVTARLHTTEVEIVYDRGGKRLATRRFPMPDEQAQADFLVEARDRFKAETDVVEQSGSRIWHALKPMNLLVVCVLLTIGAQNYFTTDWFDAKANRERIDRMGDDRRDNQPDYVARGARRATVRTIAHSPALTRILVFGIIALAAVGTVLNLLGYTATMAIVLGATGLCLAWTLLRLANPPRTMSVVALSSGR